MTIDTSKIKISTKSVVAAVVAFGSLMQNPQVSSFVLGIVAHHARLASIVASLTAIAGLLHNPAVEKELGIDESGQ